MDDGEDEKANAPASEEVTRRAIEEAEEVSQEIERKLEEDPILSLWDRPEPSKKVSGTSCDHRTATDELAGEYRGVEFDAGSDLVDRIERIAEADDKAADEVIRTALWEYVDDR